VSEWTTETLKEHFETLLAERDNRLQQRYDAQQDALKAALLAQEKAVATAMTAAKEAVTKAETAAERRFEGINEFRGQLADQQQTFIPRTEANAAIERNTERVADLVERVNALASRIDTQQGKSSGIAASWGVLVSVMVLVGIVAGVVGHFVS